MASGNFPTWKVFLSLQADITAAPCLQQVDPKTSPRHPHLLEFMSLCNPLPFGMGKACDF